MSWLKIDLPFKIQEPILTVGADIKNSLCFAYGRTAFISEVVNDLQIIDNFKKFKRTIAFISKRFGLQPRIIAYDKHPEYFSTKYILSLSKLLKAKFISVQHHHAHIASCMLENNLYNQRVIGVAFDGTGFGNDQNLWGGEFLIADYKTFKRAAHLRYIPLLGGERAIYEPWRVALAWLYLAFGKNFLSLNLKFVKRINKKYWIILEKMWKQNFNVPLTSSIGRLFDATAALLLGIYKVRFEAEAAIKLEKLACCYKSKLRGYRFGIKQTNQHLVIDPVLIFKGIVTDLINKCNIEEIAAYFHLTVAQMIRNTCIKIRNNTKINIVILTGGVFQNKFLLSLSLELLRKAGFNILTHKILSCSDAGISLGQAAVAFYTN